MKRRLDALEARLQHSVDAIPAPREPVDGGEVLRVLYETGIFPQHINAAIENDAVDAGELILDWLGGAVS